MPNPEMTPKPGDRLCKFVGDNVRFALRAGTETSHGGWKAVLRTNLGRAEALRRDIITARAAGIAKTGDSWRDIPMKRNGAGEWELEMALSEPGFFKAKAYLQDEKGWQYWPHGQDAGISVHPNYCRTANLIYCAFPRLLGPQRQLSIGKDIALEAQLASYDAQGYTVIPPSGKLRDMTALLPHVFSELKCAILHLLPVHPTPTTFARFGRFGSPYAALDLTAIDPALVVFDKRTTGIDQFQELTHHAHLLGGRVFLDIVINHTGWGSRLQENCPEWFLKHRDGMFASPGAWGNTWEDLVELRQDNVELWSELSEMFLTWCRRGVDGFRCDAGYKVPVAAWQYIVARVRQHFPETVFLLEGLGGAWEATETLLTEGGMQWAYSELFQNYSGPEVHTYLRHSIEQSQRVGLLVHYSETHDNERLAKKGREWSLLRNKLCALASTCGGYGFTSGVEWLATERIDVHASTGLNWGSADNIAPELRALNELLAEHPCFFDGASIELLTPDDSPVVAFTRTSSGHKETVLVLVNTDVKKPRSITFQIAGAVGYTPGQWYDLLGNGAPLLTGPSGKELLTLEPGGAYCLAPEDKKPSMTGSEYRRLRALAAFGVEAMAAVMPAERVVVEDWIALANLVQRSPTNFLSAVTEVAGMSGHDGAAGLAALQAAFSKQQSKAAFSNVVEWTLQDASRVFCIPPGHWVLVTDTWPFRCSWKMNGAGIPIHRQSTSFGHLHATFLAPHNLGAYTNAILHLERYSPDGSRAKIRGDALLLHNEPQVLCPPKQGDIALLTNGRGGMARLAVDFGCVYSKYDCALGANLHSEVPVDRHVFVKRMRAWVNADGFISPLDFSCLERFQQDAAGACWDFVAAAGDGRTVQIRAQAAMQENANTVVFTFSRPSVVAAKGKQLPAEADVRLTLRLDIEDRNFHSETKHNAGADYHFKAHTKPLPGPQQGFAFTPARDRHLKVVASSGVFYPQPEWCFNIPHPVEQSRGQEGSGDAYSPGWFEIPMPKDFSWSMAISAESGEMDPRALAQEIDAAAASSKNAPPLREDRFETALTRACKAFVVRREAFKTVIAGYPWFLDWGRDTLICARGLLAAGMVDEVLELLNTFARFEENGTLPNTIHGQDATNRDTTDAPLWFGVVLEELARIRGEGLYSENIGKDGRTFLSTLRSIASHCVSGTPNGIRMDPRSGLLWSPAHFTWMDTNYPACTPREGYPIEIQALWARLLKHLARVDADNTRWGELAVLAETSLRELFWLPEEGWFSDVILASSGQSANQGIRDDALRSNCLLAVSLGLATGENAKRTVAAAQRYLMVPGALRTLAPLPVRTPLIIRSPGGALLSDPNQPYRGSYEGDEDTRRKPAYHNGSAWTWTFPSFCESLAAVWSFAPEAVSAAKAYLLSAQLLMQEGCRGHLPELVDGDAPHRQRGCDAQAWGATETLRVWKLLKEASAPQTNENDGGAM